MAVPVSNSAPPTGNALIDGLLQGSSWNFGGGPHVLTYSLNIAFDTELPPGNWTPAWQTAVFNALTAWGAVADLQFVLQGTPNTQLQNQSPADIAIALERAGGPAPFLGLGIFPDPAYADQVLAGFGYTRNTGQFPVPNPEGDIVFLSDQATFASLNPGSQGFAVILHEIGHALGLKHPNDDGGNGRPTFAQLGISAFNTLQYTVMAGAPDFFFSPSTPMPLDILTIQAMYGPNLAYHTGNDVYALTSATRFQTIWDAGGIDTLDASALFTGPTVIDLTPGNFSGLPRTNNQIAIAYNVVIENAIGSNGNDTITGNAANNNLSGGGGSDTLDGREGADTIAGGQGDDTFVVDNPGDVVIENTNEGTDSLQSAITFTLPANVENLTLIGPNHLNGAGNDGANIVTGNSGNNALNGGPGADTLMGGGGDDTYVLDDALPGTRLEVRNGQGLFFYSSLTAPDIVTVNASDSSTDGDTLVDTVSINVNSVPLGSPYLFANAVFSTRNLNAPLVVGGYTGATRWPFEGANPGLQVFANGSGANTLTGSFTVTAAEFDYSGATPQVVRLAIDFQQFGDGSTVPWTGSVRIGMPPSEAQDAVVEAANGGIDTVQAPFSYTLAANVENLVLTGAGNVNGTGNSLDNALTGNSGINVLTGGAGNDRLNGGAGADVLVGGEGFDTAVFNLANANYQVEKLPGLVLVRSTDGVTVLGAVEKMQFGNGITQLLPVGGIGTTEDWSVVGAVVSRANHSELLWKNVNGRVGTWVLDGAVVASEALVGSAPLEWTIKQIGDFNGDGKGDLLWQNVNGQVALWAMNEGVFLGASLVGSAPQGWTIMDAGDFDGDAKSDILWRNAQTRQIAIWAMNGAAFKQAFLVGNTPDGWALQGSADFNGDGKNDLLWRHQDGSVAIWTMNGPVFTGGFLVGAVSSDWTIAEAADFSGDGKGDILWHNANGQVAVWTLDGPSFTGAYLVGGGAKLSSITGADDYITDGRAEILGRDANGQPVLWELGGAGAGAIPIVRGHELNGAATETGLDITGASGGDTLIGGPGNDRYTIDHANDAIVEQPGQGADTAYSSLADYTLASNVENLALLPGAVSGTGNALDNVLVGNAANNLLSGAGGADTLNASAGHDVLQGGSGSDTLTDSMANNLFDGGADADTMSGGSGAEFFAGGTGNDVISTGSGTDVIAFNRGDGQDIINASVSQDNTLSLGGGISYAELFFRKQNNDLVLETGNTEEISLKDWFAGLGNQSVQKLQVVAEAMAGYSQGSADALFDDKIETYDFSVLVNAFDQARAANPALDHWALMNKLLDAHLGAGSDSEALGGDLAYRYGLVGSLAGLALTPVQSILSDASFGSTPQTLQSLADLQNGTIKLV